MVCHCARVDLLIVFFGLKWQKTIQDNLYRIKKYLLGFQTGLNLENVTYKLIYLNDTPLIKYFDKAFYPLAEKFYCKIFER